MRAKKKLAARMLKTSPSKVRFAFDALEEIKKAITRSDIRGLIAIRKITKSKANLQSKVRARKNAAQKRKGRQKGRGSKKGSKHSIITKKEKWMIKIRTQRNFLKELRGKNLLSAKDYRKAYTKSKGGYFRNRRHIKLYLTENNMFQQKKDKSSAKKTTQK